MKIREQGAKELLLFVLTPDGIFFVLTPDGLVHATAGLSPHQTDRFFTRPKGPLAGQAGYTTIGGNYGVEL